MNGGGTVLKKPAASSLSKVHAIKRDRYCPYWSKNSCPSHLRLQLHPTAAHPLGQCGGRFDWSNK